jgi:hypothetical protein
MFGALSRYAKGASGNRWKPLYLRSQGEPNAHASYGYAQLLMSLMAK